jgi:hypothetical protein
VDAEVEKLDELTQQLIDAQAVLSYQVHYKFEVLLNDIIRPEKYDALPYGTRAMVMSIQRDMEDLL